LNVWHLYYCRYRQFHRFLRKIVENVFLIKPQMGTRIHRNTSSEPLTTFLRRTMRSRQDVLFSFGSFLPKFFCHGNSVGSLEILDSIFEFADPENLTISAKKLSIFCAEVNSVQVWLIFAQIWLPWQLLWLP